MYVKYRRIYFIDEKSFGDVSSDVVRVKHVVEDVDVVEDVVEDVAERLSVAVEGVLEVGDREEEGSLQ